MEQEIYPSETGQETPYVSEADRRVYERPGQGLKLRENVQIIRRGLKEGNPFIKKELLTLINDFYNNPKEKGIPRDLIKALSQFGDKSLNPELLTYEYVNAALNKQEKIRENGRKRVIVFSSGPLLTIPLPLLILKKSYEIYNHFFATNLSFGENELFYSLIAGGILAFAGCVYGVNRQTNLAWYENPDLAEKRELDQLARSADSARGKLDSDKSILENLVKIHNSFQGGSNE